MLFLSYNIVILIFRKDKEGKKKRKKERVCVKERGREREERIITINNK